MEITSCNLQICIFETVNSRGDKNVEDGNKDNEDEINEYLRITLRRVFFLTEIFL